MKMEAVERIIILRRLVEIYNQALKEQGVRSIELGASVAEGTVRYAVYEAKKDGQSKRKNIVAGPDVDLLFRQIGGQYGIDVHALIQRVNVLWKN